MGNGLCSKRTKIRQLGLIITIWRLCFGERETKRERVKAREGMSKKGSRFRERNGVGQENKLN